jgi:hypothetical protein
VYFGTARLAAGLARGKWHIQNRGLELGLCGVSQYNCVVDSSISAESADICSKCARIFAANNGEGF